MKITTVACFLPEGAAALAMETMTYNRQAKTFSGSLRFKGVSCETFRQDNKFGATVLAHAAFFPDVNPYHAEEASQFIQKLQDSGIEYMVKEEDKNVT